MNGTCKWSSNQERDEYFDDGVYTTECGNAWEFSDGGTPEEHKINYCPYCGRKLEAEQ